MITEAFDDRSSAIIEPKINENAPEVAACIVTFSHIIEEAVRDRYACGVFGEYHFATGATPVYRIDDHGKTFAFFRTYVGASACVGSIEDSFALIRTKKYILFGGAGCLDKEIAHGRVMVPTAAYRDEGTSYHYAPAADYIAMPNWKQVADCMAENGIPFVTGKTWTTDSFYRETRNNFEKRKKDGCISVEMESAAVQAMCDFRGLEAYIFFTSGDLLDAPQWDERRKANDPSGTQHDTGHFSIALALAEFITQ